MLDSSQFRDPVTRDFLSDLPSLLECQVVLVSAQPGARHASPVLSLCPVVAPSRTFLCSLLGSRGLTRAAEDGPSSSENERMCPPLLAPCGQEVPAPPGVSAHRLEHSDLRKSRPCDEPTETSGQPSLSQQEGTAGRVARSWCRARGWLPAGRSPDLQFLRQSSPVERATEGSWVSGQVARSPR